MRTQFGGRRKLAQRLPEQDNQSTIFDGHEIMRYIKDIALVPIPMFDRRDHPSVPTCLPRRVAANGGQGWPKATAKRRVASLMAVRCYAILGAGGGHVRTRFPLPLPGVPTSDGKRKWEAHQKACSAPHQRTRSLSRPVLTAVRCAAGYGSGGAARPVAARREGSCWLPG